MTATRRRQGPGNYNLAYTVRETSRPGRHRSVRWPLMAGRWFYIPRVRKLIQGIAYALIWTAMLVGGWFALGALTAVLNWLAGG